MIIIILTIIILTIILLLIIFEKVERTEMVKRWVKKVMMLINSLYEYVIPPEQRENTIKILREGAVVAALITVGSYIYKKYFKKYFK